jgi:hypothetical protein
MMRFLQQYETGEGDYSEERHTKLEKTDVKALSGKIRSRRGKERKRGDRGLQQKIGRGPKGGLLPDF